MPDAQVDGHVVLLSNRKKCNHVVGSIYTLSYKATEVLIPDSSDIYIDVLQLPISKQMVGRSTIDVFLLMLNEVELFRTGDLADSVEV